MQEKKASDRSGSTRKQIRFPDDMLARIRQSDEARNLSAWVLDACQQKLASAARVSSSPGRAFDERGG